MAGQDYDKDLYLVLVGSGSTTLKNFVDNVEDYIFGDRDEREATLLMPYTKNLSPYLGKILNEWAIGQEPDDENGDMVLLDDPNYPVFAYVESEAGHKSIAKAKKSLMIEDSHGITMSSAALEQAMSDLVKYQKEGHEVAVVVLYDETKDVDLIGELKNYNSVNILNVNGMIDDFPGFKTMEELLKEEKLRDEFATKEAIRIAAEKEQEKLDKPAPAKKSAAPRKRAAKAPEDKPLTETKQRAPRKKAVAPAPVVEPDHKVGDTVVVEGIPFTKHSELPSELEPVKTIERELNDMKLPEVAPDTQSATDTATVGKWADAARAQGSVDTGEVTHYSVKKDSLLALGEGIKAMSVAHAKTIDALMEIIEGK